RRARLGQSRHLGDQRGGPRGGAGVVAAGGASQAAPEASLALVPPLAEQASAGASPDTVVGVCDDGHTGVPVVRSCGMIIRAVAISLAHSEPLGIRRGVRGHTYWGFLTTSAVSACAADRTRQENTRFMKRTLMRLGVGATAVALAGVPGVAGADNGPTVDPEDGPVSYAIPAAFDLPDGTAKNPPTSGFKHMVRSPESPGQVTPPDKAPSKYPYVESLAVTADPSSAGQFINVNHERPDG